MPSDWIVPSALRFPRRGRSLALLTALCLALAVVLAADIGTAQAARGGNPGPKGGIPTHGVAGRDDRCPVDPPIGDLNSFYGVSWHIVTPSGVCGAVAPGEFWTPSVLWTVNATFEETPPGFVPAGPTPLADFVAKFVAVKYVVDPGTRQARTYQFGKEKGAGLWTGQFFGSPAANTVTLGPLRPLPPGPHVVEVSFVLSAMHCDGLGTDPDLQCLPAGETLLGSIPFDVKAPAP
jgi:hypothetical protein